MSGGLRRDALGAAQRRLACRALLVTLGVGAAVMPARAQPSAVETGERLLDAARFDDAIAAFDGALASDRGLDRALLVRALRGRAVALHARRDEDGARAAIEWLVALEPAIELGRRAPPSLRRLLEEVRRGGADGVRVEVGVSPQPGAVDVVVDARPRGLVRRIVIHHDGPNGWERSEGARVRVPAQDVLRYFVEAHGPGGAVLESVGTRAQPRLVQVPAPLLGSVGAADTSGGDAGGARSSRRTWPWVVVGVLVVGAAVSLGLVFGLAERGQRFTSPVEIMR